MLIFHEFPDRVSAENFARRIKNDSGSSAAIYASQSESDTVAHFPWQLTAPIVLVERNKWEEWIVKEAKWYGGEFASR